MSEIKKAAIDICVDQLIIVAKELIAELKFTNEEEFVAKHGINVNTLRWYCCRHDHLLQSLEKETETKR